jgi:hypothetical protein
MHMLREQGGPGARRPDGRRARRLLAVLTIFFLVGLGPVVGGRLATAAGEGRSGWPPAWARREEPVRPQTTFGVLTPRRARGTPSDVAWLPAALVGLAFLGAGWTTLRDATAPARGRTRRDPVLARGPPSPTLA